MKKSDFNAVRTAYENSACALEDAVCEALKPHGAKGVDVSGDDVVAHDVTIDEDIKVEKVRFYDNALEAFDGDDWIDISLFNGNADYVVKLNYLACMLEMKPGVFDAE